LKQFKGKIQGAIVSGQKMRIFLIKDFAAGKMPESFIEISEPPKPGVRKIQ
jgi:hypothetical protein